MEQLGSKGTGEAFALFRLALAKVSGHDYAQIPLLSHMILTIDQQTELNAALHRLLSGEPIQYILGETWFYGRRFIVHPAVLIPRPETEELVDWVIKDWGSVSGVRVLEPGTGSGCIACSLALGLNSPEISAFDISGEALKLAIENAKLLGAKVSFKVKDMLDYRSSEQWDIVVSNPPYIPPSEAASLSAEVREHEPAMALFTLSEDPLQFYKAILGLAERCLSKRGAVYLETHYRYAEDVAGLFETAGWLSRVRKDISGNNRMVKAVKA